MARKGMATKQGGIFLLRGKMKELNKSLIEARKEHKRTNDSVSEKRVSDIRGKIAATKASINAYRLGKRKSPSEQVDSITDFLGFRSGGLSQKSKMTGTGSYKGKKHSYAAGGMVKELKI